MISGGKCRMKCKNIRIRSRKYQKYYYCMRKKQEIDISNCYNCSYKEYKQYRKMNQKSKKLRQLEDNRTSIITEDMEHCYLCQKMMKKHEVNKHEVFFGTGNRIQSMKYGLIVPLCNNCHTIDNLSVHNNYFTDIKLKQLGQKIFEERYSHEEFMRIFKKNYL